MDPAEVWLKGEDDYKAYFPSDSGRFCLEGWFLYESILVVEGPDLPLSVRTTTSRSVSSSASSSGTGTSASYQSHLPPKSPSTKVTFHHHLLSVQ